LCNIENFNLENSLTYNFLCKDPIKSLLKIIEDILSTLWGHDEDFDTYDEDSFSTIESEKGNDLGCEQQIIKCQELNGRLLPSTSRSCEIKYGKNTTKRAKMRLAMRRKRGKCSVKRDNEHISKTVQLIMNIMQKRDNQNGL
jgi:hypothetical protein